MNRVSLALSAIATTTVATIAAVVPASALENRSSTNLVSPVKAMETKTELTSDTTNYFGDSTVIGAEHDALGLPRLSLEQVAGSLQVNPDTVDESVIEQFNESKPASANGIVYQFE